MLSFHSPHSSWKKVAVQVSSSLCLDLIPSCRALLFFSLSASCCEGFLSLSGSGVLAPPAPGSLTVFPSSAVHAHCCCWDTGAAGGRHECPSSSSSFPSHFLLPLFQMTHELASSLCQPARLPPPLTFPPSASLFYHILFSVYLHHRWSHLPVLLWQYAESIKHPPGRIPSSDGGLDFPRRSRLVWEVSRQEGDN